MAQVKKALVENGVVTNVALFDADKMPDWADSWVDAAADTSIGFVYDGSNFIEPQPTAEELAEKLQAWRDTVSTSRRAFCLEAYRQGFLPEAEALEAAKGEWPTSFDVALSGQPADVVAEAKIEWGAVSTIYRNAPLLEVVRLSKGYTPEQVDALFQ